MENLQAVLDRSGSHLNQVVKTTVFIKNMADYSIFNQIYGEYFKNHKPARATVEVSNLPKGALVEIEIIAVLKV